MNWKRVVLLLVLVSLLLVSLASTIAQAQKSKEFRIEWYVITAGGGQASSDNLRLVGEAGESTVGTEPPSSDNYVVRPGKMLPGDPLPYKVYLPVVTKQ